MALGCWVGCQFALKVHYVHKPGIACFSPHGGARVLTEQASAVFFGSTGRTTSWTELQRYKLALHVKTNLKQMESVLDSNVQQRAPLADHELVVMFYLGRGHCWCLFAYH